MNSDKQSTPDKYTALTEPVVELQALNKYLGKMSTFLFSFKIIKSECLVISEIRNSLLRICAGNV